MKQQLFSRQCRESKLQGEKRSEQIRICQDEACPFCSGMSRECSIFLRGITMTAVKITTKSILVPGNPKFSHMK